MDEGTDMTVKQRHPWRWLIIAVSSLLLVCAAFFGVLVVVGMRSGGGGLGLRLFGAGTETVATIPQDPPDVEDFRAIVVTPTTIQMMGIDGCEYRVNDQPWQSDRSWTGLTPNTEYSVQARYAEVNEYMASDAISVTVRTAKETITVTFDMNPRDAQQTFTTDPPATQHIPWNTKATDPGPAKSPQYRFFEWTLDTSGHERFTFDNLLKDDITLFATWQDLLTQDALVDGDIELASRTTTSIALSKFDGAEYRLKEDGAEWQDSNKFTGLTPATTYTFEIRLKQTDDYAASGILDFDATTAKENLTVTFDFNKLSPDQVVSTLLPAAQEVAFGAVAEKPTPTPKSEGYHFKGWYTDTAGTKAWVWTDGVKDDMTLYGKWELGDSLAIAKITVVPERRTPVTGNNATWFKVELVPAGSAYYANADHSATNVVWASDGLYQTDTHGVWDSAAAGMDLEPDVDDGNYDVYLTGFSHISRVLKDVDFSSDGVELTFTYDEDAIAAHTVDGVLSYVKSDLLYPLFVGDVKILVDPDNSYANDGMLTGDEWGDDVVNGMDVGELLELLGRSYADSQKTLSPISKGDLNGDGVVNGIDVGLALENIGMSGDRSE